MEKQVNKEKYNFNDYCKEDRWVSYWHQLNETLKVKPKSVLEIGVGDKVFANYLKDNTDIKYTSLDIAEDLNPDVIGSVEKMPFTDSEFDVVCAFEILEHLPFEKFSISLCELKRVSKKYIILSLPHWGRHFSVEMRMPFLGKMRWNKKINIFPIKHKFNGEHYWEIGKRAYSLENIKQIIHETGLAIDSDFVPHNSPYHHFFILNKI